jgi:hypothetical protein
LRHLSLSWLWPSRARRNRSATQIIASGDEMRALPGARCAKSAPP